MQQKPPDPPRAALASAPAPGQDREAALALSGDEAFARRAMYVPFPHDCCTLTADCTLHESDCSMNCEPRTLCEHLVLQADSAVSYPISTSQCHAVLASEKKGKRHPSTHISAVPE